MLLKVALILSIAVGVQCSVNYEQDTTLTRKEAQAFQKFKNRVIPKVKLDYQKEDLFLLKFLKVKNYDVNKAEENFLREMKWRADYNIEGIHEEDFSDVSKESGMRVEGTDREGRPLIIWELGDFDLRKYSIAGKTDRIVRWTFKNWDHAFQKVREASNAGRNATRWTMILDLSNINAITNVNPASFPYYISASLGYDQHWPGYGDRIFLINTPGLFETVLALVRPGLAQDTRENLMVFGKTGWKEAVDAVIDPNMLPQRYGGTREDYQ